MGLAKAGARRIHYDSVGEGPAVLLVPGIGAGARLFGTLPRRFARHGFRCLSFDPVGLPPSSPLQGAYDMDQAAEDLLAVIEAAGVRTCALIGTSFGGRVAVCAAASAPQRISALVLLASTATSSARGRRLQRAFATMAEHLPQGALFDVLAPFLFGATFLAERADLVSEIGRATACQESGRALMRAQAEAGDDLDGAASAKAVRCPTLCLAGAEDTLTSGSEVARTAALFADATHEVIAGAGHSLLLESPATFIRIESFLRACPGVARHEGS